MIKLFISLPLKLREGFFLVKVKFISMISVKVKFRPSTVDGKEGSLYYQIIYKRVPRQFVTDYKIKTTEWNIYSGNLEI